MATNEKHLATCINSARDICFEIIYRRNNKNTTANACILLNLLKHIERIASDKVSEHATFFPDNPALYDLDIRNILRQADDAVLRWNDSTYNIEQALLEVNHFIDALLSTVGNIDPILANNLTRSFHDHKLILTALLTDSLHRTIPASEDRHHA